MCVLSQLDSSLGRVRCRVWARITLLRWLWWWLLLLLLLVGILGVERMRAGLDMAMLRIVAMYLRLWLRRSKRLHVRVEEMVRGGGMAGLLEVLLRRHVQLLALIRVWAAQGNGICACVLTAKTGGQWLVWTWEMTQRRETRQNTWRGVLPSQGVALGMHLAHANHLEIIISMELRNTTKQCNVNGGSENIPTRTEAPSRAHIAQKARQTAPIRLVLAHTIRKSKPNEEGLVSHNTQLTRPYLWDGDSSIANKPLVDLAHCKWKNLW
jgi:hypothetical protein